VLATVWVGSRVKEGKGKRRKERCEGIEGRSRERWKLRERDEEGGRGEGQ
jgi:hypothetical protein